MKQFFDIFNEPIVRNPRIITKKLGAPRKYPILYDKDGKQISTGMLCYKKRGHIISKINTLIKNHGFNKITPAEFRTKTEPDLLMILTKMQMEIITLNNVEYITQSNSIPVY